LHRLLAKVPADPYDGKPLRYRRLKDGVVIYCIGPDGKDDGGTFERDDFWAASTDVGLRLWDVDKRRQPPEPPKPPDDFPLNPDGEKDK
jgi:hypothetical protein